MTCFLQFAKLCQQIEAVSGSLEKTAMLASFLTELDEEELGIIPTFVMGSPFPASSPMLLGVGPSTLYEALSKATGCSLAKINERLRKTGDVGAVAAETVGKRLQPTFATFMGHNQLSISDVHKRFLDIARASGKKSQGAKMKNLQYIFSESSSIEAQYIARMALEDMRIGVGEGVVRDAVAKAFDRTPEDVERAYCLTNDLGLVAQKAKEDRLLDLSIKVGRPIKMMLAQLGSGIESSLSDIGSAAAAEWKFDGSRVQIHGDGDDIQIYSRRLENVTKSLPEIVQAIKDHVHAESFILDGEAVAIGKDGRPLPFQEILKRFRRKYKVERLAAQIPLGIYLFDLVYMNGEDLIDLPLKDRRSLLEKAVDSTIVAEQTLTQDPKEIEQIYNEALKVGHEGLMLKNPSSPYLPGKRGKNWLKIKPVMETLDLVVIGARWGEGRRAKLFGTYRLACRDPYTGNLVDVGWVATGITDEMLADLTEMFSDFVITTEGMEMEFKPKVVFEVAYEEIQKSSNYSSGYALRFPRLVGVREDKSLDDADTSERLESLYLSQRGRNGQSSAKRKC